MSRQRAWTLAAAAAVLLATAGFALVVRSGDEKPDAAPSASASPTVRVVAPGRPGETAEVTDSDKARRPQVPTYNAVDTRFVQMMIVHHQQAIQMADLAPQRAANTQLRALATRMSVTQKGEIKVLRSWLDARGLPADVSGHDHATMPGMQSEAAIAALTAARGADFDRRFVEMMTAHHRGAQQMAGDVLRGGSDLQLSEMANEMAIEQGSEIQRMAQLGVG